MKEKIKVLQSVNSLGIGGNPIFVMNFFRYIDKEKFQVDFVIYDDTRLDYYEEVISAGSKVHICTTNKKGKFAKCLSHAMQTYKLLKREHYDVIHCHNCSFLGIMRGALPGRFVSGTKVIAHSHNVGAPKNTILDNVLRLILKGMLSKSVDYGFACSDLAGESKYTKKFMKSDKYLVIKNAIDVTKYEYNPRLREDLRNLYQIGNRKVIGNIGRLAEQKNQRFLLKIFAKLQEKSSDTVLLIVGGGELEEELKTLAQELNISSNVIFTGMVNNPQDYYSVMDVFVFPSLFEGFGLVLLEAQAAGLMCIASDKVPIDTQITGDVRYISLGETSDVWANEILALDTGKNRLEKSYEACEMIREKGYSVRDEVRQMEQIYEVTYY